LDQRLDLVYATHLHISLLERDFETELLHRHLPFFLKVLAFGVYICRKRWGKCYGEHCSKDRRMPEAEAAWQKSDLHS